MKFCVLALLFAFLAPIGSMAQAPVELLGSDSEIGDLFGRSVAINGDDIVVGAPGHDLNGTESGAVYVFQNQNSVWSEVAKLVATDGISNDRLGHSVAIGDGYVIAGAIGTDDNGFSSGAAYVFERDNGTWSQQQKLTPANGDARKFFGEAVAMSGEYAIIGAPGIGFNNESPGTAYIYQLIDAMWTEIATLSPSDGAASDSFGISVAISDSIAVVGTSQQNIAGQASGSVYVFQKNGGQWTQIDKLTASDAEARDFFGASVAVYQDELLVGAYGDDDNGADAGAVYFFQKNESQWTENIKYIASDGRSNNSFGRAVAMNEAFTVIGERKDDDVGQNSGAIYILRKENGNWIERGKLINEDGIQGDLFGFSVGISNQIAIVGVPRADVNGNTLGSVLVYELTTIAPVITSVVSTSTLYIGQPFTYDVDATGIPSPAYSLTNGPIGMTIDAGSGLISWAPTIPGEYAITIEASNGILPASTQAFSITVLNNAPEITSSPRPRGRINELYSYQVEATGNPAPTYSLTQNPTGMVINETTGLLEWTPGEAGTFVVTAVASNGIAPEASQQFTIAVEEDVSSSVEDETVATFQLGQNYPNPFRSSTQVNFTIVHPGTVHITIIDALGRVQYVKNIPHNGPGQYAFEWDGEDRAGRVLPAGLYFLHITQPALGSQVIAMVKTE